MEMKQMLERLLAGQAKADARQEQMKQEMLARIDAHYKKAIATMDAWFTETKDGRREAMACQQTTEANPETTMACQQLTEANPETMDANPETTEAC
jgi:hypothetical protein